ncbi:MAG: NUDIX domain-containing protein, partial [Gammaproteobacteria bacterium]|nr:NUDIX domain-containing protein [Gammaproteobacteria bacterium]
MTLRTFFSSGPIIRDSTLRTDAATIAALLEHPETRFIALWQSRCTIDNDRVRLLQRAELGSSWLPERAIYLGTLDEQPVFAVALHETLPDDGPDEDLFADHGALLAMASADDAATLAFAKGMIEWQQRHLYCGRCGTPNQVSDGGFVMTCGNDACGHRSFPRIDPVVIMLVINDDRCLLGRQASWPEQRFSALAGFAEPGESLEDAVRREVAEESGVQVSDVRYLG